MDQIGWGILGPGRIARRFMNDLPRLADARLAAVASRSAEKAREFAKEYHFEKSYGSYEEMICDPGVDIVYIATPHPFHDEQAMLCMQAGKAVLCEKPVAVNAGQARQMVECARKMDVFFMEAMWTRFFPVNQKVKALLDSGELGQVTLIQADFGGGSLRDARITDPASRIHAAQLAGGSLLDLGVYCVSYAAFMTGQNPVDVTARAVMTESGVDGMTACILCYGSGSMAMLESSFIQATRHTAMIYCEHGSVEVPDFWHPSRAVIRRKGCPDETIDMPYDADGATGFGFEAAHAMACMKKGLSESPVMTWRQSIDIMDTLDRIRACIGLKYPFED